MGQSSSQQVSNGPNELPEDIEDDGPPVLKTHRRKDAENEKPPQSSGDKLVSKRKRKYSSKASKDNNACEPQLPVAPVPTSSGSFRDEQDSRPSKCNRVSEPAQKEKRDGRKTDGEGAGAENGTVKDEDTGQRSGLSDLVDAQPLEQPAKPKTSQPQKRERKEPTETKTKPTAPLSQIASNNYATNKEKPSRAHSSSKKETLTGFFTSEEVQLLENFKLEFSNNHRLTGETFDRMVQHSERDKVDFPCDPSIITKQDFWRSIYETIPRRDRRSVYRFMRRHFQASTQKPHHWTNEQDEELVSLHARYGPKWAFIAKLIGRNDDDVTQRWKNRLEHRGTMLRGPWTAEEIHALQDALKSSWENMKKAGHNLGKDIYEMEETLIGWGQVSNRMENKRSRQQCADKWRRIRQRILNLRAKGNPDATYEPTVELRSPKKPKPPAVTVEKHQPKYKSSEFVNSDEEDEDADGQGEIEPSPGKGSPVKKETDTSNETSESGSNSKTTSNTRATSESDSDSDSSSTQSRQASVDKANNTSTDKQQSQKRKRSPTPPKSSSDSDSDSESDSSSSESESDKQPPRKRQSTDPASTTGTDSSKPTSKSPAAAAATTTTTVKDTNTSNKNNPEKGEGSSSSESESDSDSESESEPISGENAARDSSSSSSQNNEKQTPKQNETTKGQKPQSPVKTNTHTSTSADASSTDSSDSDADSESESESESEDEDEKDNPEDVNKKSEEHAEKKPLQPQPPNRPSESSSSESNSDSDSESESESESEDEKDTASKPATTVPQQPFSSSSSSIKEKKDIKPPQPESSMEDSDSSNSDSDSSSSSSSSSKNTPNSPNPKIKTEGTPSSSSSALSATNTKPPTKMPPKTEPTPTPARTSLSSIKQELKRERESSISSSQRGKPRVMNGGNGLGVKKEEGDDEMVGVKRSGSDDESSSDDSESESESDDSD